MAKRKRRAFTKEFKAGAVQLVRESGKSVPTVARSVCQGYSDVHLSAPSESESARA